MNKRLRAMVLGAAVLVGAGVGVGVATAEAAGFQTIASYFALVYCNSTGQLCQPAHSHSLNLNSTSQVRLTYTVNQYPSQGVPNPSGHCSSVRTHLSVDGLAVGSSPFLGWTSGPGWGADPQGRPLSHTFDLGVLGAGNHTLALQFEGTAGGCNLGNLSSVGGPVKVEAEVVQKPQCSDAIDNDGDGKIDYPADLGCENPDDNDEKDKPECSDGRDNDGDGKVDSADPGCHTDGDPNDGDDTYNPNDDDERDEKKDKPECSDDEDNDGDKKIDIADPGCHTDGDPNDNDDSYDPKDDDERDQKKEVKAIKVVKVAQITPQAVKVTAKTGAGSIIALAATLLGATGLAITRKIS